MKADDLPKDVRAMVWNGWYAVVFEGLQVYGVFPQRILAAGYIAAVADPEDRARYKIVGPDSI